jgi:hypothetical protein
MNTLKLKTLIAAAAVTLVVLGPAADVAQAEKPKAGPSAQSQGSRYARGDDRGRGNGGQAQDRGRGNDQRSYGQGRGNDQRNYDRSRGSDPRSYSPYRGDDQRSYDYGRGDHRRYDDRSRGYDYRNYARPVQHRHYTYYDARWNHRHYYPPRGYYYPYAPYGAVRIRHHHHHYYYGGGIWYAPRGVGWVVVAPPIGVFVSLLPSFYTTVWFGGIPYYYANDAYYVYRERERAYEVVQPPYGAQATTVSPAAEDIYVYPRQGQSQEQTDIDRYECHRWAADETGFDPTRADGGVGADQANAARNEYQRAMTACLEGRGYSVR